MNKGKCEGCGEIKEISSDGYCLLLCKECIKIRDGINKEEEDEF